MNAYKKSKLLTLHVNKIENETKDVFKNTMKQTIEESNHFNETVLKQLCNIQIQ